MRIKHKQAIFPILGAALLALLCAPALAAPKPVLTTLHRFAGPDGAFPQTTLTPGSDGNLYGVSVSGGLGVSPTNSGFGTVFGMTPAGRFATLWRFHGGDGRNPYGPLVQGADGAFYGTTFQGGGADRGTVFRITRQGRLTVLHHFAGPEGTNPIGGLALAPDGTLYGTTTEGGADNKGTLFQLSAAGEFAVLHSFTGSYRINPTGTLLIGPDGALYGTTYLGGPADAGTVFRCTRSGQFRTLHTLGNTDGAYPAAGLTVGPDGALYGVTAGGGGEGLDTVYRITTAGQFTVLLRFRYDDGQGNFPQSPLTLGRDGLLYGTTMEHTPPRLGTVFSVTTRGSLKTLYRFTDRSEGVLPIAGVVFGRNGALYGMTQSGPANLGTVFEVTLPTLTTSTTTMPLNAANRKTLELQP